MAGTQSLCSIKSAELADEICKEIDEMNNTGMFLESRFAIGDYLGMQVQIVITRDEDEIIDDQLDLLEFRSAKR